MKKTKKKSTRIAIEDQASPQMRPDTSQNWSEAEDRSEEFINETDPYIQKPEKDIHEIRREIKKEEKS
jgi:hypothetical protein